jgi:hypothetical protein
MTVPAAQGMEFDRVVLDLGNAGWLEGGAYSGISRVKGKLEDGLRIRGGGNVVNADCFRANLEVLDWVMDVVMNLC